MKLSNNVDKKVCFKVKTTAPKRYCVKPTTGVIDPKGAVTILVTLQPFDPNDPNEKGKHKFQVLSALAPEGEFNIETLVSFLFNISFHFWKLFSCLSFLSLQWKESSLEINDWKLKCVLEIPEEAATASVVAPVAASSAGSVYLHTHTFM